ncbi:MAG: dihydroneopterin aldolase [Balneolaceae bacterium]
MDTLTIKSVQLHGNHGYYESEQSDGNKFELDVILRADFRPAAITDDLSLTCNYETVEEVARQVMQGPSQKLIESLCLKIGDRLFERFPTVTHMELALRKLDPPLQQPTAYSEIRMEWQRP